MPTFVSVRERWAQITNAWVVNNPRVLGWRYEHGVDYGGLIGHEFAARLDPDRKVLTIALIHPALCGCDFYPNQLELEG